MSFPNDEFGVEKQDPNAARREAVVRQVLDPQARLRLGNVRMVRPELAATVENYLVELAARGQTQQVTDEQLKQILQSLNQPKRSFKINRV